MKIIKIILAVVLLIWFATNVNIVESDAGQIVSHEKVAIDSTVKEIKMVTPDEIQRLENKRDREIILLKRDMAELKIRVAYLESQNNQ